MRCMACTQAEGSAPGAARTAAGGCRPPRCGRDRPAAATAEETTDTGAFPEEDLSGTVRADGSSTVAPLVSLAAERFRQEEPGVKVTVGISGTGGGFERFCRGETDLANASRPIKDEEIAACKKKGIDYLELQVANDGLSVVVNNGNDWAKCLTVEQLKKIWQPGSKIKNWKDVDPSFPSQNAVAFRRGDRLRHLRLLHRRDRRRGRGEPLGLHGDRGRQRHGSRRRRRKGSAGLLRAFLLREQQGQAEGSRDRRRRRLRRAERRDRAETARTSPCRDRCSPTSRSRRRSRSWRWTRFSSSSSTTRKRSPEGLSSCR